MAEKIVFIGIIATSSSDKDLSLFTGYLAVENGKITKKGPVEEFDKLLNSGVFPGFKILRLTPDQFLIPGFVDCHTHAPQFPNIGLGLDRPLLEWLDLYTFPLEIQYKNVEFANKVYDKVVQRLIKSGTTTACYFGSLHLEGTLELVKSAIKHNHRALIGKVSMNISNDAGYYNDTEKDLEDVESFVKTVLNYNNDLVQPVVTPRFALSCDLKLMNGLAKISDQYNCRVQSHISENQTEIELVLKMYPECKSYADVYDKCGLLNNRCIMAHGIYLTDEEIKLIVEKGVTVAHCPSSNTRLKSGLCPVKKLLNKHVIVGLGTDVSGGDHATIMDAIRRTMDVSTSLELSGHHHYSIDWKEAFYLATLGGARALQLDEKIGSFEVGKEFDALLIDVFAKGGPIDRYDWETNENDEKYAVSLMQRFIYLGDDRNISQVYIKGVKVKDISVDNIVKKSSKSKCFLN